VQQRPVSGVFSEANSDGVGGSGSVAGWAQKGMEVEAVVEELEESPERKDTSGDVEK